eukprot:6202343-Pleurochrysis_carterae.AAC.2
MHTRPLIDSLARQQALPLSALFPCAPATRPTMAVRFLCGREVAINRAYYLPRWCSVADYAKLASDFGLEQARARHATLRRWGMRVLRVSPRATVC